MRVWRGPCGALYPMLVLPVADFMSLARAPPHQELLAQGVLHRFRERSGMTAVFVSHQWCGSRHADPHFRQLGVRCCWLGVNGGCRLIGEGSHQ